MRGLWKMGAVAMAAVVVAGSAGLAQPPGLKKDLAETPPFWSNWFGGSDKPAKLEGIDPKDVKGKGAVAPQPVAPPVSKAERSEGLNIAFARRQAVIDKLREIAMETNDAALADEALRLEEMAQRVFKQEAGKVTGVAATVPQPDSLDPDGGPAVRGASPRGRGPTPESLERASHNRGGDR